jgi:hypothetical protein
MERSIDNRVIFTMSEVQLVIRVATAECCRRSGFERAARTPGETSVMLDSLVPEMELIVKRPGYWHHGIYVGEGRVP